MKKQLFIWAMLFTFSTKGQSADCILMPPTVAINFGSGATADLNTTASYNYRRVLRSCPTDGYYTYTSYTSDCFRGDWHTLEQDHTQGDVDGNMMLVNASPYTGTFLTTKIDGLKGGTVYEFSLWMMNVCKISEKCPFPLLPDIGVLLLKPDGEVLSHFSVGELVRRSSPQWTKYAVFITTPPTQTPLTLVMTNRAPGGCGNDFALDDISFSECVKKPSIVNAPSKNPGVKKQPTAQKPSFNSTPKHPVFAAKKPTASPGTTTSGPKPGAKATVKKATSQPITKAPIPPAKSQPEIGRLSSPPVTINESPAPVKQKPAAFPAAPPVITGRSNQLVKVIETLPGEIRLDLYDNGEIDGDTVSVYHNNRLVVSHARLSAKPIALRISIDASNPHHELVMVAHNLGTIPPNTSLMVVTAGTKRYEVFISSTESKNARVVFELKE